MKRCLQIAQNGIGLTRPNPSVGAVIVHQNRIIGEGFTSPFGGNHAEVNAINTVKDKSLLKEATMYVTLEPCSHFGKTPPCADLIVKHQIKKVVVGCLDSNPVVAGKGIDRLEKAGIEVVTGFLEDDCRKQHRRFFTFQEQKRPYLILKWAETKDGFVSPELVSGSPKKMLKQVQHNKPFWISNPYSQQLVHKFRAKEHAILVGTNTVIADNPKLNVRSWTGNSPIRIVLDRNLRIPTSANVYDGSAKTILITEERNLKDKVVNENLIFEAIDFSNNIAFEISAILYKHNIQSVIIEGGTKTLQTFIDANLWDEALVFVADQFLEKGIKAPKFSAKSSSEIKIKNDLLKTFYND